MSKSEDNEFLDFELSEKPQKKSGSMEHAQDEMEQRRQAQGLTNQSSEACTLCSLNLFYAAPAYLLSIE